jgi:hypothetical protein
MSGVAGRLSGFLGKVAAGVKRFPLPLAAGFVGAAAGVAIMSKHVHGGAEDVFAHILFTSWLGVALFLAAALAGERGAPGRALLSLVAAAALAGCYASLGGHADEWTAIRFSLFIVAAHALLALAPLAGPPPRGDFRAFNLMLFSRTALALLLTHVLVAGLAFALAAVQHLFDVKIPEALYPQLWFALLGVFNTAYVLAGIPRDWDRLEGRFPTPRALDVLARLVLLPLSALYLAILYVYSVKIIVAHEWPRGWVSAPIIVFGAIGLLTVLLLEPGRLTGTRLVRAYCRGFFVALLPLVVLLFLAIARRTNEYGLTEERCILYSIAAFLALVGSYFLFSRVRNLAVIPLVLAVIALLTAVGPLSARSLSVRSQTARARALLGKHHRLASGRLTRATAAAPRKDEHELSAALMYLESRGALGPVLAWRPASDACSGCKGLAAASTARDLVLALGLHYRPWDRDSSDDRQTTSLWAAVPSAVETTGYDIVFPSLNCYGGERCQGLDGDAKERWRARVEGVSLLVTHDGHEAARVPLARVVRDATAVDEDDGGGSQRDKPVVIDGSAASARYRLYVRSASFERGDDGGPAKVASLDGVLLLGLGR